MTKKANISGQRLNNLSDSKLAYPHPAGTRVYFAQPSLDKKWGRYYYYYYPRNYIIFMASRRYYTKTIKLLDKCRQLPINTQTNTRTVTDNLRNKLEVASMNFLVLTKIGFEYLTAEYLQTIGKIKTHKRENFNIPKDDSDLLEKIKALVAGIGLNLPIPQAIKILMERRDIVEHPTLNRLYNSTETGWKNNHLAWVLSGELEGLFEQIIPFVNSINQEIEKYIKNNPVPGTLTRIKRGTKAGESAKRYKN